MVRTPSPDPASSPVSPTGPAGAVTPPSPAPRAGAAAAVPDRSRFLGALAYVPTWCFLPYFVSPRDPFARGHGRQAFLLLFLAVVIGLATRLAEWALSPVPVLGVFAQVLMRLVFAVGFVLLSGLGALRALTGEPTTLRPLARLASRLPI